MALEHIEFLVEERSMLVFLETVLPQIIGDMSFEIRVFDGKHNLLRKLESRLRGYLHLEGVNIAVVVLIDEDREDCYALKQRLEDAAAAVGLPTLSNAGAAQPVVLNRIVVEELESWLLGDPIALCAAYPKVPSTFYTRQRYRDCDAVRGGTAEALSDLLVRAGHAEEATRKTIVAGQVAQHIVVDRNMSESFRAFRTGLEALMAARSSTTTKGV
ncbi:DUF4276 family protein [Gordonia sp. NPDC003429]